MQSLKLGVSGFSASHFLAALLLLFVATPFIDRPPYGERIESIAMTLVLLTATLAVGGRATTLIVAALLLAPALLSKWIDHVAPGLIPDYLGPASMVAFLLFIAFHFLRFVTNAPKVTREVVCAGIAAYLVIGLLWIFAYILVSRLQPNAFALFGQPITQFNGLDAFYLSFITLIGIGYGDITPVSRVAQMLAVMEGVTGTFFMVILISRLVANYVPRGNEPSDPPPPVGDH